MVSRSEVSIMSLKQQIDADLKQAMLSGDKTLTTTLRGLKSAILYAEVATGERQQGLDDAAILQLLTKEAKKRQESADLYRQGGSEERAETELREKEVISRYLPTQLTDDELDGIVDEVLSEYDVVSPKLMGPVIAEVKQKVGVAADGARVAVKVKGKLGL